MAKERTACVMCSAPFSRTLRKYCGNACKSKAHYHAHKSNPNSYHSQSVRAVRRKLMFVEEMGGIRVWIPPQSGRSGFSPCRPEGIQGGCEAVVQYLHCSPSAVGVRDVVEVPFSREASQRTPRRGVPTAYEAPVGRARRARRSVDTSTASGTATPSARTGLMRSTRQLSPRAPSP